MKKSLFKKGLIFSLLFCTFLCIFPKKILAEGACVIYPPRLYYGTYQINIFNPEIEEGVNKYAMVVTDNNGYTASMEYSANSDRIINATLTITASNNHGKIDIRRNNISRKLICSKQIIDLFYGQDNPQAVPTMPNSNSPVTSFNNLKDAIPGLVVQFQPGAATNVGSIISLILPYLFIIAGLLLLFYLLLGGFHMMTAGSDEKGLVEAKGKITNALIGFLLLFVSYWLVQILGVILGMQIF